MCSMETLIEGGRWRGLFCWPLNVLQSNNLLDIPPNHHRLLQLSYSRKPLRFCRLHISSLLQSSLTIQVIASTYQDVLLRTISTPMWRLQMGQFQTALRQGIQNWRNLRHEVGLWHNPLPRQLQVVHQDPDKTRPHIQRGGKGSQMETRRKQAQRLNREIWRRDPRPSTRNCQLGMGKEGEASWHRRPSIILDGSTSRLSIHNPARIVCVVQ